jgi:hypothetical protein
LKPFLFTSPLTLCLLHFLPDLISSGTSKHLVLILLDMVEKATAKPLHRTDDGNVDPASFSHGMEETEPSCTGHRE